LIKKPKSNWFVIGIALLVIFLILGGGSLVSNYFGGATHACPAGTTWDGAQCKVTTQSGTWEVAISAATYSDAGVTVSIATGGTSVSYSGAAADLGDNNAGGATGNAYANVTFRVINRNSGDSVLWPTSAFCGVYDSVDGGAGAVYPLVTQHATDPSIRKVEWTSSQASPAGSQVSAVFSESILTASSDNFVAHIDILDAALGTGATISVVYTVHITVAGYDFPIYFQRTS